MHTALRETRIFVVEDDPDSAEVLTALLERAGAEVGRAANGEDALTLLRTFTPDVLMLDIGLPDMDGYELLGRIRAQSLSFLATPAIAATAHAHARDRERARAVGFAVHTAKPFDPEALVHLVARLAAEARREGASVPPRSATLEELVAVLENRGLPATLQALNARTPYRYTGVYRYDGDMLRNVALADRLDPQLEKGADAALETTFCSLLQRDRASFAAVDGGSDPRVAGLPIQPDIRSYCGALIRNSDGTPFGSLCHFDHVPRDVPHEEVELLEQLAPVFARTVATEIF